MYSIDTNILINIYNVHYPPSVFPALWEHVNDAYKSSFFVSSEMVKVELENGNDELAEWVKQNKDFFTDVDEEIQDIVIDINSKLVPPLVDKDNQKSVADPFVIALAIQKSLTVVSSEKFQVLNPSQKLQKIPNACQTLGVRCITLPELLKETGWKF